MTDHNPSDVSVITATAIFALRGRRQVGSGNAIPHLNHYNLIKTMSCGRSTDFAFNHQVSQREPRAALFRSSRRRKETAGMKEEPLLRQNTRFVGRPPGAGSRCPPPDLHKTSPTPQPARGVSRRGPRAGLRL